MKRIMMRLLVSLILLCANAAAFSANTDTQELFQQPDAPRYTVAAPHQNAANQANPKVDLSLAKSLFWGTKEQRQNHREACRLFEEAAARGSVEATAWLGKCYIYGKGFAKIDIARGVSLIQTAAQADDQAGLVFLGELYELGNGVEPDYVKAAGLFSRAVSKDYAPAYGRLGRLYLRGLGVKLNRRKAFGLFEKGAQMGDPMSQFHLGLLASLGFVGPQGEFLGRRSNSPNYEMAFQYFSQAAAQGDRSAAFKAAQMYEHQLGVAQDPKKAAGLYRQAARAGDIRAQLTMGRLTENAPGRGPVYSYAWYSLAISQGNEEARDYLASLRAKMTREQVREAEELFVSWKANGFCYGCR